MSKIKTLLAFAALLLCGGTWAATPVAVWDGDLDILNKDGYTLNLNGNTGTKDAITVGSKGIKVTIPGNGFENYMGSIIVQYSGVTAYPSATKALATFDSNRGQDYTGVCVRNTGDVYGILTGGDWNNDSNVSRGKIPLTEGSHRLGFVVEMTPRAVKRRGTHACIDGTSVYSVGGLVGSSTIVTGFCIGGEDKTTLGSLEGMVIEKIAIFNDALTDDEVTNFKFPSETTYYTAAVSSDVTWANLAWTDSKTWGNDNSCDATISVTADAKLTIGAAVTAKKVTFDIAEGKTLTLAASAAITAADNVYVTGKGTIRFDDSTGGFKAVGGSNGTAVKLDLSAESTMELYRADTWNYSGCNFTAVTGTGTIKLSGTNWQCIPGSGAIWPLTHPVVNTLTSGMILSAGNTTYTMANYSGNGDVSTTNGSNARNLTVIQSEDLTWSGTLAADGTARFGTFTVQGSGANKTLTYTGDNSSKQAGALTVDASGSMKMNGNWKAKNAVVINGEFGGTGTITGAATITVGVGAKIRADWGAVTLNKAPTVGALVDVVATEIPANNKVKLFAGTSFTQPDGWTTSYARVLVGETVQYGTVAVEADGVYATISDDAMTAAMDAAAKYKYEMNGSFENSASSGVNLTVGGSFAAGDFRDSTVLSLGTNVGNHYGTAGFAYGSGAWTIVTAVKAPAANQCVFGVGGAKGVAGMIGLRNAGSNTMKLFTANATDLCGVTLDVDPTAAFHYYTIVYENGTIKMNVDGGAFCAAVPFTPGTGTGWQMGGIVSGGNNNHSANATSGEMDCFRMYSFPFVKADTKVKASIGDAKFLDLTTALSLAEAGDTVTLLAANAETVTIPANVMVDVAGFAFTGTVKGSGKIKFAGFAPIKDATALKNSLKDGNNWTGTLVITQPTSGQIGNGDNTVDGSNKTLLNNYGNVNSKIEFLNCTYQSGNNNYFGKSYVDGGTGDVVVQPEIVVTGEFKLNNGYSQTNRSGDLNNYTIFRKLSGTGTIASTYASQLFVILDGSDFTGAINTTHKKFIFGSIDANDRTADGQPAAGAVVIKEGNSVTIGADQNWSASGGVTVGGTLVLGAAATATTKAYSIALKGTGTISAKATSASTQMKYVLSNHANFTGSITTEVGAHVMLAPANTATTSLGFSNCGFICIQSGSATIGDGKTWTGGVNNGNGGAYLAANTRLNVGGAASIVGKLYALNSTIAFANWNSSLTIDGNFQADGAGTRIAISLPNEALEEEKTLISWTGKVNVSGETFTCANLPAGYDLSVEDTRLKLVQVQDLVSERTTDVSNSVSMNSLWIGANGVQKFTGTGGVQASDLQMRDGSVLVIDPVKNPLYITRATPTFVAGAKIKLDAAYAGKKGTAMLMVWEGEAEPTLPENLFDTETYPNSALSFKHYTSDLQSNDSSGNVIPTVAKTMTALVVDLDTTYPKKQLKIMPLGDSITEGTNQVGFGNPNYRMFLLARLAIEGYDVSSTGFRRVKTMNAAGAAMPSEWCWHNGVSGQRLCSSGSRAGWRDALEPTLDASEIPDIITFKIGTNDQGTNVEQLYAEWVAVMKRIIAARPSTKIIVGSIMDIVRNDNWENDWNLKLKDAIEQNTPGFPANQVFFADLNKANPRNGEGGAYLGTFYSSTDLHPNWIGHEKNARCWADAIVAALADDKALTAKYEPNLKTGALANVAPEYLKGFVKLATFKPNNAAIAKNATPTYAAKANIDSNAKITKVGYYMELKNSRSGNVRWVWADMDNWNAAEADKVFSKIEVPSAYTYQGEANNLHVDTNDGGIEKIAPDVEGKKAWLQFCRGGAGNGGNVSGAPGNFFGWDWNDQMNDGGSYGIMQLYRVAPTVVEGGVTGDNSRAAQVLMAFNRFTSANGQEIGIGNCAIHGAPKTAANVTTTVNYMMTTDYDRLNLASYDLATIEIWGVVDGTQYVMPDAPALEVEASTADEATAACAVVTDAAADSEAGQGGQAQFLTLQATRVGESGNWKVQAVVDNEKLPENKKIDDTAVAFANAGGIVKLAGATEKQTISIPKTSTTAGLYYSVSFGTTPDDHTQESERVLATSGEGTVDIPVPALGGEKVYYIKIKASATK